MRCRNDRLLRPLSRIDRGQAIALERSDYNCLRSVVYLVVDACQDFAVGREDLIVDRLVLEQALYIIEGNCVIPQLEFEILELVIALVCGVPLFDAFCDLGVVRQYIFLLFVGH